jgi:hypothetical protein
MISDSYNDKTKMFTILSVIRKNLNFSGVCHIGCCLTYTSNGKLNFKAALHQGNNWQHFLVVTGNITKKCCRQHVTRVDEGFYFLILKNRSDFDDFFSMVFFIQYNFDNPDRYSFEPRRIREFSGLARYIHF